MMKTISKQQLGVTFGGFIMILIILAGVAIFAMKLIPSYMEYGEIQKTLEAIVHDPEMQTASIKEIKDSFSKRANIMNDVSSVNPDDLVISKDGGVLSLSASYSKKIPLVGNVSLFIEFKPSAPK
jgi:hypothetical protein